jgi:membrane protein implicated in regulation of membrane protease activity
MALPLLDPMRDMALATVRRMEFRAVTLVATACLLVAATGFLATAGFAVLMPLLGLPGTALVFAALFALLALAMYLFGRAMSARQARQARAAQKRAEADVALVATLARSARSARPLLPLAAFLAAFGLARRL